jgi:hypothetical protein
MACRPAATACKRGEALSGYCGLEKVDWSINKFCLVTSLLGFLATPFHSVRYLHIGLESDSSFVLG